MQYKNREVTIEKYIPATEEDKVLIKYTDNETTEVVNAGALDRNEEETAAYFKDERKKLDDREKAAKDQAKAKADADKKHIEHMKEKQEAAKKGLPQDAWLKTATYSKGDNVTQDGVTYRSKVNGNIGNQPSEKSQYWTLVRPVVTA